VPTEQRVRRDDRRDLAQHLPPEPVRPRGKLPPVVIGEPRSPSTQLPAQHSILFDQVRQDLPLLAVQPAGDSQKQHAVSRDVDHGAGAYITAVKLTLRPGLRPVLLLRMLDVSPSRWNAVAGRWGGGDTLSVRGDTGDGRGRTDAARCDRRVRCGAGRLRFRPERTVVHLLQRERSFSIAPQRDPVPSISGSDCLAVGKPWWTRRALDTVFGHSSLGVNMTKRINTLATIIAAFGLTTLLEAQSPAGKWLASLPNGTIMALDLTTTGNAVTGTIFVETPAGAISAGLTKVSLTGTTLSFSVSLAGKESAFTAEIADGEIRLRSVANAGGQPLILKRVDALPATLAATPIVTPPGWRSVTRSARVVEEAGRSIVRIGERAGEGVVWLESAMVEDGIIEVEMRGKDVVGQSSVGLAFRGLDDTRF
jgi:hypothetical protein